MDFPVSALIKLANENKHYCLRFKAFKREHQSRKVIFQGAGKFFFLMHYIELMVPLFTAFQRVTFASFVTRAVMLSKQSRR